MYWEYTECKKISSLRGKKRVNVTSYERLSIQKKHSSSFKRCKLSSYLSKPSKVDHHFLWSYIYSFT